MSDASVPPAAAKPGGIRGVFKAILGGGVGLATGVVGMYATALVNKVAKPPMPVANFAVQADGLAVTVQNHATGESGWWDFGDGSPLEPFSDQAEAVPHAYAKPGSYSVRLVVRNFMNDENERTVPVDLTGAKATAAGEPSVVGLTVTPVGQTAAPATYRISGEVKNADRVVWDLGQGDKPEVTTANGPFTKLVVFEKPGAFPLSVLAMNGASVSKAGGTVQVSAPAAGAVSAVIRVTDTGTATEQKKAPQTATFAVPSKPVGGFEKTVWAQAGWTIADAKIGGVVSKAAKDLKLEVAADKRSAKLTGAWAGSDGANLLVPLDITLARGAPLKGEPQTVSVVLAKSFFSAYPSVSVIPPALPPGADKMPDFKRRVDVRLHEAQANGTDRVVAVADDLKPPLVGVVTMGNGQQQRAEFTLSPKGELQILLRPADKR